MTRYAPQEDRVYLQLNVCSPGLGLDRSINVCFGLNESHPDVCSGKGVYVDFNSWSCNTFFSGERCEVSVFGLLYSLGGNDKGQLGDDFYDGTRYLPATKPTIHSQRSMLNKRKRVSKIPSP